MIYTVCNGDGIGLCGEILQELYIVYSYLTRFRTYTKLLYHPRGPQTENTCRQVPLQVNFLEKPTFRVWCLYSYLVHRAFPLLSSFSDLTSKVLSRGRPRAVKLNCHNTDLSRNIFHIYYILLFH
jgi:hypothetical protein